jgi:hypothetical protein
METFARYVEDRNLRVVYEQFDQYGPVLLDI